MTAVRKPVVETDVPDPGNAMLDLVERGIDLAVECGLEAPLRARLARLLPAPPSPAPFCIAPSDSASRSRPEGAGDVDLALHLTLLLTALADIERLRLSSSTHHTLRRARDHVNAILAAFAKHSRNPSNQET